ncbi:phage antirepressor KilAC domain-containing protein [Lactiplantibacillus plantarum]|uniref:phage antirepressor KilAC domain-containing protein n=1 Tax=Lactiplantibacillus plantarum TaxID=1590 RepID=UPI00215D9A26|nr:phage antirepressor KilAC domain-containing protein [Lactiplantibacillus plantarum]
MGERPISKGGVDLNYFKQRQAYRNLKRNQIDISTGPLKRYNSPTQRAMELGIMEVRETVITTNHGSKTRFTPLITGKGQQYFANKFLKSKSMVKEG